MDALKILSKYHDEWLNIVRLFGDSEFAEDVVQDVYLIVHQYYLDKVIINEEPNRALMWILLRNTAYRANKNTFEEISIDLIKNLSSEEFDLLKHESLDKIYDKIEQEIELFKWYDQVLFRIYREDNMSMRQISKQTGIGLKSIFLTIKSCKNKIKDAVAEDYEDYQNNDYDLI